MAQVSSGSFNTTSAEGRYLTFKWGVESTNIAENYKEISWSLTGAGVGGFVTCGNFKVTISGNVVYNSATRIDVYNGTVIASGRYKMAMSSDGTKTFKATAEAGIYSIAVNCRGEGTWELPTINRYAKITNFVVEKANETSVKYNWSADVECDYAWYSTDNGANWHGLPNSNIVSGLTANTSYNFKLRVRRKDSQLTTDSGTYQQTTYDYPKPTAINDFIIGNDVKAEVYNPLGRTYKLELVNDNNGIILGDYTGAKNGEVIGFHDSNSVANQYASIPNSKSGSYHLRVTYEGSVKTLGNKTYKINESECTPIVGNFSYKDNNSTTTSITGDNQRIIRNNSVLLFTIGNATARRSASISKYEVIFASSTKSRTNAGDLDFGTINLASNEKAILRVTDSRGLTATKEITVIIDDWELPTAIISLSRQNNYYSESYLKVDGSCSSLNGKNSFTIQYQYKKTTESNYSALTNITDNTQATLNLDNNYQWNFQVIIKDKIGTRIYNALLDRGMPIVFFDRIKSSLGVNRLPQRDRSIEGEGTMVLGQKEGFTIQAGETKSFTLYLLNSALVNIRMSGANLEVTRLLYVVRTNQYYAQGYTLSDLSMNNTSASVPMNMQNTTEGYTISFTNNHSSAINVFYGLFELC